MLCGAKCVGTVLACQLAVLNVSQLFPIIQEIKLECVHVDHIKEVSHGKFRKSTD